MSAADLLHRLHDAGLTLEPDGARVIVRPKSLLTDEQREAIRSHKAELLELLALLSEPTPAATDEHEKPTTLGDLPIARACKGCAHRTAYGTCGEPVAAGLADTWGIAWAPASYAETCPAFTRRAAA